MKLIAWTVAAATALLAACGGGGDSASPAAPPTIAAFSVEPSAVPMGERARLVAVFSGGSGRIEPGIGPVASGVPVQTPVLDGDVAYRLVVEAAGQPAASRALSIPVHHRNRFVAAGRFRSSYHAAVELPDGSVLVVGGSRGASALSNAVDRFDPVTRNFAPVGTMATGRAVPRLVRLADGRVLVAGGLTAAAAGVTYELIDVASGQVSPAGVPVRHRVGHSATLLPDGRVLIAGGFEDSSAELWDPATRTSQPVGARMANPRQGHTATVLADGRVLIVGGFTMAPVYWLAEIFDPRTEQFTALGVPRVAPFNETLGLHLAHRLGDGTVLIAGGERFIPDVDADGRPTAQVLRFDPATGEFTAQPSLIVPRTLLSAAVLADDRVLLFGGMGEGFEPVSFGETYRPGRGSVATAGLGGARTFHTVSRLPGGRLLIVGGEDADGNLVPDVLIYE